MAVAETLGTMKLEKDCARGGIGFQLIVQIWVVVLVQQSSIHCHVVGIVAVVEELENLVDVDKVAELGRRLEVGGSFGAGKLEMAGAVGSSAFLDWQIGPDCKNWEMEAEVGNFGLIGMRRRA